MSELILERPAAAITESQIRRYEQDGAICLRGLFNEDWLERLRSVTQRSLEAGGMEMSAAGDAGRFHSNLFLWARDPDMRAFVFESPAAKIAKALMRSRQVRFYFDHLFVKSPGTQAPTPWHHDQPYWPVRGMNISSIWVTMDPVTLQTGGLEYVKGSHRWGKRFDPAEFGPGSFAASLHDDENLKIPDINAHRNEYEFLSWDMQPGDCLVHNSLTVHGAAGNSSSTLWRRAMSTRWLGDDAVYWPLPNGEGGLHDPALKKGQPLSIERFPAVST